MSNLAFDNQLQRIQSLCNQFALHAERQHTSVGLTVYASISPSMDRRSNVITVIVGTQQGGLELPCESQSIPSNQLEHLTGSQIQNFINNCVQRFMNPQ